MISCDYAPWWRHWMTRWGAEQTNPWWRHWMTRWGADQTDEAALKQLNAERDLRAIPSVISQLTGMENDVRHQHRIQCRGLWYAACDIRNMLSSNSTLCFKSKFRGNYKLTKELFVWWINQPVFTFAVVTILQHEDMHGSFGMISSKRKVAKIGQSR